MATLVAGGFRVLGLLGLYWALLRNAMTEHVLKCWPEYFAKVLSGEKRFEIRRNDRRFQAGDPVTLREYEPGTDTYTGAELRFRVGYMTSYEQQPGFVVFGLDPH
jgi:Domain of unknown function (DUF3850)